MKAEELRIGNITDKGLIKSFYESGIHVGLGKTYPFNDVKPIPLTEEWLEKFGFEQSKSDNKEWHEPNYGWSIYENSGYYKLASSDGNDLIGKQFNKVHQLQNLYLALTNEELKVKELTQTNKA